MRFLATLAALCLSLALQGQSADGAFQPGAGSHTFRDPAINQGRPLRVFYQVPARCRPDAPVLMVMHGVNRDADRYRDDWKAVAERQGAVLVCPEFSRADFPGDPSYNFGNVYGAAREGEPLPRPLPEAQWSFSCLDPIFEAVAARLKLSTRGYLLYGHSAGAQFVHRLPWFKPGTRALRIVSANAGWYMFPDPAVAFPYGLGGTGLDEARLRQVLALPITVLLGDQDIDPNHSQLRRTPGAMAQGAFRLARGRAYFEAARRQAERLRTPFGWRLATAPGVGHRDREMAPFAERELFPEAAPPPRVPLTGDQAPGEGRPDPHGKAGKGLLR